MQSDTVRGLARLQIWAVYSARPYSALRGVRGRVTSTDSSRCRSSKEAIKPQVIEVVLAYEEVPAALTNRNSLFAALRPPGGDGDGCGFVQLLISRRRWMI